MEERIEIEKLKNEYASLKSEAEKAEFDIRFKAILASKTSEEKKLFAKAFFESRKETVRRANKVAEYVDLRLKLESILDAVSMAYISEKYFHKSRGWFNQRLNNNIVNGNPVSFNPEELNTLSFALDDLGTKMKDIARSIPC